jgi:hypothetical protein
MEIELTPLEESALDTKAEQVAEYLKSTLRSYVEENARDYYAQMYLYQKVMANLTGQFPLF